MATGLGAMPDPRSAGAPYFSSQPNDPLAAFLQEFDALATSHKLTDGQKVRTTWNTSCPPYATFGRPSMDSAQPTGKPSAPPSKALYPATRYTKIDLEDFVDISAMSRVRDQEDVMLYYRRFL
jgi:hypothetical protein